MEFGIVGDVATASRVEDLIHEAIAAKAYSMADRMISFACYPE